MRNVRNSITDFNLYPMQIYSRWIKDLKGKTTCRKNVSRYLYDHREETMSNIQNFCLLKVSERISFKLGKGFYCSYNWQRISMRTCKDFIWIDKKATHLALRAPRTCCPGAKTIWQKYRNFSFDLISHSCECVQIESPPKKKRDFFDPIFPLQWMYPNRISPLERKGTTKTLKTSQCPVTADKSKEVQDICSVE